MELEYRLITETDELLKYKKDIFVLFEHCFNRTIDPGVWEWQYLKNPIGAALVSLCFDGELLVGHYAAIQLPIKVEGNSKRALLSVGSMVYNSYRKYGIFVKQGEHLYAAVNDIFFCVIGFPNKMALPARKKRLGWTIDEADYVALVTKNQLMGSKDFNELVHQTMDIELDLEENEFMRWRLSKPATHYERFDSLIIKEFEGNHDIVYLREGFTDQLDDDKYYYVLCDGCVESLKPYKAFDYPFGYRVFEGEKKAYTFKKDLILSDVF